MKKLLLGGLLIAAAASALAAADQWQVGVLVAPHQTNTAYSGRGDQGYVDPSRIIVLEAPHPYPAVDAHAHVTATPESYEMAIKTMDAAGIALTINVSGGSGDTLDRNIACAAKYPGRFLQFCGANPRGDEWNAPDVGERIARTIQESHDKGAVGFGEIVKWSLNGHIKWDDPRLDPMWSKLEELHMPVNWHAGAPTHQFLPVGPYNTLEGPAYYKNAQLKQEILNQQERVLEKHPNLIVIAAHSNYLMDELPLLVYRFEKYPNYNIDIAAVAEQWGKVPELFTYICHDYQDRVFFGTDAGYSGGKTVEEGSMDKAVAHLKAFHLAYFLFLGTSQKMIPCPYDGNQGRFLIGWVNGFTRYAHDGVALPKDILEKIYYKNAERLFGIKVADWTPATPVNLESTADWQQPAAPRAPRSGEQGSRGAGERPSAAQQVSR